MLRFYDYREPIPPEDVIDCTEIAATAAYRHPGVSHIASGQLRFRSDDFVLTLYPWKMTWRMCANTAWGIRKFVKSTHMFFGFSFWIFDREILVGQGVLSEVLGGSEISQARTFAGLRR